jgi:hypothetical protein
LCKLLFPIVTINHSFLEKWIVILLCCISSLTFKPWEPAKPQQSNWESPPGQVLILVERDCAEMKVPFRGFLMSYHDV